MRHLTADFIFSADKGFCKNSVLIVDKNGLVQDLIADADRELLEKAEKFRGVLCPGFINAHCHLELSHMKGKVQQRTGFTGFAKQLIPQRNYISHDEIEVVCMEADAEMFTNGISGVGDISNIEVSFEAKRVSKMRYHTFIELLGLNPEVADKHFEAGVALKKKAPRPASLSPHAPYSVAPGLLRHIVREENHKTVVTIHNQESQAENEFTQYGTGDMLDLYAFFGTDISWYKPSGKNSIQTYLSDLTGGFNLLLVHNTFTDSNDIKFANSVQRNLYWCLCPNANLYIENTLPDVMLLKNSGCKLTIGTDSLASNFGLSVLEELKVLHQYFAEIAVSDLLTWATKNGADALCFDELGTFEKGKKPGVILLEGVDSEKIARESVVVRVI